MWKTCTINTAIIKSEGKYMNREIEQAILTEGYRFCRVQPENIGVFYKYYQQGFHVVMMISLEDTQEVKNSSFTG